MKQANTSVLRQSVPPPNSVPNPDAAMVQLQPNATLCLKHLASHGAVLSAEQRVRCVCARACSRHAPCGTHSVEGAVPRHALAAGRPGAGAANS